VKTQLIRNIGVALLAAASVYAQGPLTVQIPFDFHAGATVMRAGEYTVDTHAAQGMVRLRSADSKSAVMLLSNNVQARSTPERGKLVFNRYGEDYFLSQVWSPGSDTGREFRKSRREIETAASIRREAQSIVARR
jgi:hypothetical protein